MKKICFAILFFLLPCKVIFAQDLTKDFNLTLPKNKIQNSLYRSIDLVDSRIDTFRLGIVQVGIFNNKAKVIFGAPFFVQLKNVMSSLIDSSAKNGELLFQLRHLYFAEITKAMSEKGYCYLRAGLYAKKDNHYRKLGYIDTLIVINAMDVTIPMLKLGSKLITDMIASNLLKEANDSINYSFAEIAQMDSVEKRKIPLYNTDKYTDGLYYSYTSFANQLPDKQVTVKNNKDGSIDNVKIADGKGKLKKVKPGEVYAMVTNGHPFAATNYGYYPIKKASDNFYFIGKAQSTADQGNVAMASFLFGMIGGLIASSNGNTTFVMVIDHHNGGFIHLREVKQHYD